MATASSPRYEYALAVFLQWCRRRETLPLLNRDDLVLWARQSPVEYRTALQDYCGRWTCNGAHDATAWPCGVDELLCPGVSEAPGQPNHIAVLRALDVVPYRAELRPPAEEGPTRPLERAFGPTKWDSARADRPVHVADVRTVRMRMFPWD